MDNFKSIPPDTNLPLSKINVFAGANSSGKSSFLQSILLIKQSFQNLSTQKSISLNGALVSLGTFDEVKNTQSDDSYIGIGWEFHPSPRAIFRASTSSSYLHGPVPTNANRLRSAHVDAYFRWKPSVHPALKEDVHATAQSLQLHPALYSAEITSSRTERDQKTPSTFSLSVTQASESVDQKLQRLGINTHIYEFLKSYFFYDVNSLDAATTREVIQGRSDAEVVGCGFSHFWPSTFGCRYNATQHQARVLADTITSVSRTSVIGSVDHTDDDVPSFIIDVVIEWLVHQGADEIAVRRFTDLHDEDYVPASYVADMLRSLLPTTSGLLSEPLDNRHGRYDLLTLHARIEAAMLERSENAVAFDVEQARVFSESGALVREYFVNMVKYLGPLRDEPRAIYQREALAAPTDVGYRGEYTAAVLDLNRDKIIQFIRAQEVSGGLLSQRSTRDTLHNAVINWLVYLGVATEVRTEDQGKLGHRLQVKTEQKGRSYDLTHVGVGVSQVLPILVMALLAPTNSLLIFEQPELHLHPKVQSRLADFFIAMSALNKQCILETHSEYMVERFRLRVAESSNEKMKDDISLYFCDRPSGNTRFRKVEMSEYGSIIEWPDDFFDHSQKETERLLLAAAAKRRNRIRSGE